MRGRDTIRVGGCGGGGVTSVYVCGGVLRAGSVTGMTSSVNGMLFYKWISADVKVKQPCTCTSTSAHTAIVWVYSTQVRRHVHAH